MKNGHEQSDGDEDDEEFGCHGSIKSIASFELPHCFPIPILHVPLHEEHEVWEWENSVAVQMIQPNVVVIWSEDSFNPYYLIKTMTEAVEIDVPFTDDYRHTFPIGHTTMKAH